jgi:hypothetical protein
VTFHSFGLRLFIFLLTNVYTQTDGGSSGLQHVPTSSLLLGNKRTAVFECDLLISQANAVGSLKTSGDVCPM